MLSINLTLPMVVNMLRTIAEREPDRVGSSGTGGCVYADVDGFVLTPVCIVGQMFSDMGLLRLLLAEPNKTGDLAVASSSCAPSSTWFWERVASFGVSVDEDAQQFAYSVQRRQDEDIPWGEAFALAVKAYRDEQEDLLTRTLDDLFNK